MLATSGIENVVRLWSPGPEPTGEEAEALQELIYSNQASIANRRDCPTAHHDDVDYRTHAMLFVQMKGRNRSTTVLRSSHLRALADNPDLYSLLLSQLRGRMAAGDPNDDDEGDDEEEEQEFEDGGGRRVQCRMN